MSETERQTEEYVLRQYESDDREAVLALYRSVFGRRSEEWFDWRYVDIPYSSEVPICVAERDGEVVGARPSLVIPLRAGDEFASAIVQVDPMVHPDHRGRGLFSRMVEHVYGHYADRSPSVSIGFPNEAVESALVKLASTLSLDDGVAGAFPEFYRVQNPGAVLDARADGKLPGPIDRLGRVAAGAYLSVRESPPGSDADVAVERREGVPVELVASLYETAVPDRVHAHRDETFLRWRYATPRYDYATYVASHDGEPVACAIAGTRPGTPEMTHVTDVLPLSGGERRAAVLARLVERIVEDYEDSDVLSAYGSVVPSDVLTAYGFHPVESFPLSTFVTADRFVARPLVDGEVAGEWTVGGRDLADLDSWAFTYCERELG